MVRRGRKEYPQLCSAEKEHRRRGFADGSLVWSSIRARCNGKARQYNRRFLQTCAHHLIGPVACTPASGWEQGRVENQVGLVCQRFLMPRLCFKTYDELSA